jgi:hypothetical protein
MRHRPEKLAPWGKKEKKGRNDMHDEELMIDEAIVDGRTKEPNTLASASSVFIPPDLATELKHYIETIAASPTAWLFPASRKEAPMRPANFLKRC